MTYQFTLDGVLCKSYSEELTFVGELSNGELLFSRIQDSRFKSKKKEWLVTEKALDGVVRMDTAKLYFRKHLALPSSF